MRDPTGSTDDQGEPSGRTGGAHHSTGPSEGDVATKNTLIRDISDQVMHNKPILAEEDASLDQLAGEIAAEPGARTIFVIDKQGELVGLIPFKELSERVFFCIVPEEFMAEASDYEHVMKYASLSCGQRAGDIMKPPAWVKPGDRVRDAFVRMHDTGVESLPILDDHMKIMSCVSMFELLSLWVRNRLAEREGSTA